jgi:hypothetical protein
MARRQLPPDGLSPLQPCYWRVDAVRKGATNEGHLWTFSLAAWLPRAEGYGRYAIGGRGGQVYHVTNLKDDGQLGSFRMGPHSSRDHVPCSTWPGSSPLAAASPSATPTSPSPDDGTRARHHVQGKALGVATDGITRFIRLRLGGGDGWSGTGPTAHHGWHRHGGQKHAIMDHCSIGWAIDEGFSSRNACNITLQHTLISEELNYAGHSHYVEQSGRYVEHGYAATIGGGVPDGVGSFHHNLLAHNNGRNWSMGGGLVGGKYAGRLDLFNNVAYNWEAAPPTAVPTRSTS